METPRDIGWRQFVIGIIELLRWPAAAIAIVVILRMPLERMLDAMRLAIHG